MSRTSQSFWQGPYTFKGGHNTQQLNAWGCRGQAGIYVIRDQQDLVTLYVGKGEGGQTGCDIYRRLKNHLSGNGNKGIQQLVHRGDTFHVRWMPSSNPFLSESILVNLLQPRCNDQPTWAGRERARIDQIVAEVERLNIGSFERRNFKDILTEAKQLNLRTARYTAFSQLLSQLVKRDNQSTPIWERSDNLPERDLPLWERSDNLPERDLPLWERSDNLPERDLPLWERNAHIHPNRKERDR